MPTGVGVAVGVGFDMKPGSSGPPPIHILITTDSTQYTIDTTTLYTIDNNNTTT